MTNAGRAAPRPYRSLVHRDFRNLAGALFVSLTGSQMQNVAVDWHVWILTRSPLALGLVGLVRVVPIVLFSLVGGIVADRFDRRRVMFLAEGVMTLSAFCLAAATFFGRETLGLVYLLTAVNAAAAAFDNPSRQSLLPRLVPASDLPGALATILTVFQVAAIGGPALAGAVIAHGAWRGSTKGLAVIYAANAVSFLAVLFVLTRLSIRDDGPRAAGTVEPPWDSLKSGLRFVFTTPVMVWTMSLDFFATFFSGAMSLLPVFADHVLGVGAAGFGWLRSAPGIGAVAGSIFMSLVPLPRRQGRLLLGSVAVYAAATVVFGLSRWFPLTLAALALVGLSDTISTVIRQTIRQLITPDELRGRMTSVNMIFFMGGPQLGELEAGFVASLFASAALGATVAVVSGGVVTLLVAAAVAVATPVVRGYERATPGDGDGDSDSDSSVT